MTKQIKSVEQVVEDLKSIFSFATEYHTNSFQIGNKFRIDKIDMERHRVIDALTNYFMLVSIKDGYLSISKNTFLYTDFEVCKGELNSK